MSSGSGIVPAVEARTVKPGELVIGKWVAGVLAAVVATGLVGLTTGVIAAASSYAKDRTEAATADAVTAEKLSAISTDLAGLKAELKESLEKLTKRAELAGTDRLTATAHSAWWRDERQSLGAIHDRIRARVDRIEERVEVHQDGHPRRVESFTEEVRRAQEALGQRIAAHDARLARLEQQMGAR